MAFKMVEDVVSTAPMLEIQKRHSQMSSESDCSTESDSDDEEFAWKRSNRMPESRHQPEASAGPASAFTFQAQRFLQERAPSLMPSLATGSSNDVDIASENPSRPTARRKPNCIWSSVLAEEGLVEDLSSVGVHNMIPNNRGSEGYNYSLKREYEERQRDPEEAQPAHRRFGRKRNVKDRLGHLSVLPKGKRAFGVDQNDPVESVVNAIVAILREPKQDLIARSVNVLGKKKALQLLQETEDIEQSGGLMTFDGSRRRTPGGVFLLLVRRDKSIKQKQKKIIFEDDRRLQMQTKRATKRAKRRRAATKVAPKEDDLKPLPSLEEIVLRESTINSSERNTKIWISRVTKTRENASEKEPGEIDSDDED